MDTIYSWFGLSKVEEECDDEDEKLDNQEYI